MYTSLTPALDDAPNLSAVILYDHEIDRLARFRDQENPILEMAEVCSVRRNRSTFGIMTIAQRVAINGRKAASANTET